MLKLCNLKMPIGVQKTKDERLGEVIKLLKKIYDLGIEETDKNLLEFKKILTEWMEDGQYRKGRVKLYGYEREILYELYSRKGMDIEICLKYRKGL